MPVAQNVQPIKFNAIIPRDLHKVLVGLPRSIAQSALQPSLKFALRPLVSDIRSILKNRKWSEGISSNPFKGHPKRKKLYQGVISVTKRYKSGNVFGAIGFRAGEIKKNYAHAMILERGSRRHPITAGQYGSQRTGRRVLIGPPPKSRPRKRYANGKNLIGRTVIHPGIRPLFYMRHTFADNRTRLGTLFNQDLRRRIPAALERYAKQQFRTKVRRELGKGTKVSQIASRTLPSLP